MRCTCPGSISTPLPANGWGTLPGSRTFRKGSGDGHHLINRSAVARYLEVGSRHPDDLTTCSDIDLESANADGRFVRKDGSPYP